MAYRLVFSDVRVVWQCRRVLVGFVHLLQPGGPKPYLPDLFSTSTELVPMALGLRIEA